MKGGFFFKINQAQIDNWRKDYRCPPDESNVDCGSNVLSFLGIPYDIARQLQLMSHDRGELTLDELTQALNLLPKDEFENAPNLEDVTIYEYENIDNMMTFLSNNLPPEYAVIVLGRRKEALFEGATLGHFFLIFKDANNSLFILDPQTSFIHTTPETIIEYLQEFSDKFLILIGRTQDGKFTKFNKLYKQIPLNMRYRKIKERSIKPTVKRLQKKSIRSLNLKRLQKNRDRMKTISRDRIGGKKGKTSKKSKKSKKSKTHKNIKK